MAGEILEDVMQDVDITEEHNTSVSVNKVEEIAVEEINDITGNRIMNMTILKPALHAQCVLQ